MNNFREVDTVLNQLIADDVALRASVREVADKLNDLMASLRTATLLNS
jgi:IMP dehydrogenase/GMP reductase